MFLFIIIYFLQKMLNIRKMLLMMQIFDKENERESEFSTDEWMTIAH